MGGCVKNKEQAKNKRKLSPLHVNQRQAISKTSMTHLKKHSEQKCQFCEVSNLKWVSSDWLGWNSEEWWWTWLHGEEYYAWMFWRRINPPSEKRESSGWGECSKCRDQKSINMREMFMLHEPTIDGKLFPIVVQCILKKNFIEKIAHDKTSSV